MWQGLAGIYAAWQVFVDTINQALPGHWWALQGLIQTLGGGGAGGGYSPTSGPAPAVALPLPTANQLLLGITGQLLTWPSTSAPPPIYYGGGGGGVIPPPSYGPPPVLQ